MIKHIHVFTALLLMSLSASPQKHDYVWLQGYRGWQGFVGYDSAFGITAGHSIFDFKQTPMLISYDSLQMSFDFTNTSFCDSNGQLLFYTNGVYIANVLDEKIANSDSLNTGYFQDVLYPLIKTYGNRNPQGVLAVPSIANPNQYYIIHSWMDTFPSNIVCKRTLTSLLDMSENSGHGKVLYKNQIVVNDYLGSELVATKHANGRDWWLLVQKRATNCYIRILVDSAGVHQLPDLTCGGTTAPINDDGAACFSPDGSKYVYFGYFCSLNVFDFDRCNGTLQNPVSIQLPITQDGSGWGMSISPSSQFLYVSFTGIMYQFDLWAADIAASVDTVGIFDGTNAPFPAQFHTHQLGPDGKIYVGCGNGDTVYHVINYPDMKGAACGFVQHGIHLPSVCIGIPNFPNYRLGALPGSPCDTISGLNETERAAKEKQIKVFPNPATDMVTIDYGFTDWSKSGEVSMEIVNELGQVVYAQPLPQYSGFQKMNIADFVGGFYTVYIRRNNQVIAASKFTKQ